MCDGRVAATPQSRGRAGLIGGDVERGMRDQYRRACMSSRLTQLTRIRFICTKQVGSCTRFCSRDRAPSATGRLLRQARGDDRADGVDTVFDDQDRLPTDVVIAVRIAQAVAGLEVGGRRGQAELPSARVSNQTMLRAGDPERPRGGPVTGNAHAQRRAVPFQTTVTRCWPGRSRATW
jgi:hypothetical protein